MLTTWVSKNVLFTDSLFLCLGHVPDQHHVHLPDPNPLPAGDDHTHVPAQDRLPLTDGEAPLSLRLRGGGTGRGPGRGRGRDRLHPGDEERKRVVLHQIMECKFL